MKREQRIKKVRQNRRLARTRKKLMQTKDRVRLTVFRSNAHMYAQLIDDQKGITLVAASEKELPVDKMPKIERAKKLGALLAEKAKEKKIEKIMFDKGSYRYHGRVRAFADAAREGGLQF